MKEPSKDPFSEGAKVVYLGVEWTVTERLFIDSCHSYFTLSRINKYDKFETASPGYWSDLVKPV